MQNKKETVIKIKGEPITIMEFQDFSLDVLVLYKGNYLMTDDEDDAILDFIHYVTECFTEIAFDELTLLDFLIAQNVTAVVLEAKTNLFSHVSASKLSEFVSIWKDLLFTDTLGSTFKETVFNLQHELYGESFHLFI